MLSDDHRAPEHTLRQIKIDFPCSDELWQAPNAQAWAQIVAKSGATGQPFGRVSVSAWLVTVLQGGVVEHLSHALDVKSALTLLHLHIRCRQLGALEEVRKPEPQ